MAIQRISLSEWCYNSVLRPFEEAAERINRFWSGVDLHRLDSPPLSWEGRFVALITGIALSIPFLNWIVWIAWKVLGTPEVLSDEYNPEPLSEIIVQIPESNLEAASPVVAATGSPELISSEEFKTIDTKDKGEVVESTWSERVYDDKIVYTKVDRECYTICEYDPGGRQVLYDCTWKSLNARRVAQLKGKKIEIYDYTQGSPRLLKEVELKGARWLQQSTTAFRSFVKSSSQTELEYVGIDPRVFATRDLPQDLLIPMKATKVATVPYGDVRDAVKVEIQLNGGLLGRAISFTGKGKGIFYFDPATGNFLRSEYVEPVDLNDIFKGFQTVICNRG